MRFSIRCLMVVIAYVALATTAFATGSYRLADLVWAVSILAFCYAVLVVCVARRQQQAVALGFVILAMAHVAGLYLVPNRVPAMQLFSAAGYFVGDTGEIYEPDPSVAAAQNAWVTSHRMIPLIRTSNAIATLAAGLIGSLLGWLAYRYSRNAVEDASAIP